ncbi:MAG: hypothetical protein AB1861_29855 [Cyanobacteriota bacterium]
MLKIKESLSKTTTVAVEFILQSTMPYAGDPFGKWFVPLVCAPIAARQVNPLQQLKDYGEQVFCVFHNTLLSLIGGAGDRYQLSSHRHNKKQIDSTTQPEP